LGNPLQQLFRRWIAGSTGFSLAFASFEVMGIHCGALYFFFRRSWEFGAA